MENSLTIQTKSEPVQISPDRKHSECGTHKSEGTRTELRQVMIQENNEN